MPGARELELMRDSVVVAEALQRGVIDNDADRHSWVAALRFQRSAHDTFRLNMPGRLVELQACESQVLVRHMEMIRQTCSFAVQTQIDKGAPLNRR